MAIPTFIKQFIINNISIHTVGVPYYITRLSVLSWAATWSGH